MMQLLAHQPSSELYVGLLGRMNELVLVYCTFALHTLHV
jgi:hypothetical protein